ncbi:hypothetical protein V6N12_041199 [Hibiscus sabdariffa]|uniref:Uncharacterized protein n=1 Tax=Hibiscus sabdariffa TaxID=183260 RepID=A0ABR2E5V4_9ROSI
MLHALLLSLWHLWLMLLTKGTSFEVDVKPDMEVELDGVVSAADMDGDLNNLGALKDLMASFCHLGKSFGGKWITSPEGLNCLHISF